MEEINMNEISGSKTTKRYDSLLPKINFNKVPQKEVDNNHINDLNNSNINMNFTESKNNNEFFEKDQINDNNNIPYSPSNNNNENYTMKKYNSQVDLFNNNYSNLNTQSDEENFSSFFGKIKIYNFYSSTEIILLVENILKRLNYKKNYSFTIKDSLITFCFVNANKALEVFKKLNIEKLNNEYYRNLGIDINFDLKTNDEKKDKEKIINELKEEYDKPNYIKILPPSINKLNETKNVNKIKNMKSYNFNTGKTPDKYFQGIYKHYIDYFRKRKEERKKKELSYIHRVNYSLQASSPYVENDNRNYFVESLRKYAGKNISPSQFNGYIDKASIKLI